MSFSLLFFQNLSNLLNSDFMMLGDQPYMHSRYVGGYYREGASGDRRTEVIIDDEDLYGSGSGSGSGDDGVDDVTHPGTGVLVPGGGDNGEYRPCLVRNTGHEVYVSI
jgi:hypothetical protein